MQNSQAASMHSTFLKSDFEGQLITLCIKGDSKKIPIIAEDESNYTYFLSNCMRYVYSISCSLRSDIPFLYGSFLCNRYGGWGGSSSWRHSWTKLPPSAQRTKNRSQHQRAFHVNALEYFWRETPSIAPCEFKGDGTGRSLRFRTARVIWK